MGTVGTHTNSQESEKIPLTVPSCPLSINYVRGITSRLFLPRVPSFAELVPVVTLCQVLLEVRVRGLKVWSREMGHRRPVDKDWKVSY